MNKERILALADLIEAQPHTDVDSKHGFNMNSILHLCGTPCCIAGWAVWEAQGRPERVDRYKYETGLEIPAAEYLEMPLDPQHYCGPAMQLFYPVDDDINDRNYKDLQPVEAAKVLRHLAETGEVDWSIINE